MSGGTPTETWVRASALLLSASQFHRLVRDVWQECMFQHNWNSVWGTDDSFFSCQRCPDSREERRYHFFFPVICLLSCSFHRGRVNKARLGLAGQLFSGSPQIPPVTRRQLLLVFFSWQENGQRGERRSGDAFTLFFMTSPWLHLLLQGRVKRKKVHSWEELLLNWPMWVPGSLINVNAVKLHSLTICHVLIGLLITSFSKQRRRDLSRVDGFGPDPFSTRYKARGRLHFSRERSGCCLFTTGNLTEVNRTASIPPVTLLLVKHTLGAVGITRLIKSFEKNSPFYLSGSLNLPLQCGKSHNFSKNALEMFVFCGYF